MRLMRYILPKCHIASLAYKKKMSEHRTIAYKYAYPRSLSCLILEAAILYCDVYEGKRKAKGMLHQGEIALAYKMNTA